MKKFLLLFSLLVFALNVGYAKPMIVAHGVVVSKVNDELIVGALVKQKNQDVVATTDVDGQFTITAEEGSTLEVTCMGYRKVTVKIKPNMVIDMVPNDYRAMHWFVAATAGPLITYEESDYYWTQNSFYSYGDKYTLARQAHFGIMFGMMGRNWGWYVKPSMPVAFKDGFFKKQIAWALSFGAMRRIVSDFNIYAGSGIGNGFWYQYYWRRPYDSGSSYYDWSRYENNFGDMFAVMFELGFQYNIRHINIELGLEYAMGTNEPAIQRNFMPYVGLGYNF